MPLAIPAVPFVPVAASTDSLQFIVLIAAVFGALGYLILKVVVPGAKLITELVATLPYLKLLPILETIKTEFSSDSGFTIRDALNRIEVHAEENKQMAIDVAKSNRDSITELQAAMIAVRELARDDRDLARKDREQLMELMKSGARVEASGVRMEEFGVRSEASGARTEASGARTEAADAAVADDLAKSQQRADGVHEEAESGQAADAASQSPD